MTLDLLSARSHGVLVVDKPRGPTSHDVVSYIRRRLHIRAVGHAGTLDPMATGLLVVALGEATKLVPWLTAHDKEYEADVTLGVQTDTLDADGRVEVERPLSDELCAALAASGTEPVAGRLRLALDVERARTLQVPPSYSAIKVKGHRAFDRARQGERFELAPRAVLVRRLEWIGATSMPPTISVRLVVGAGYYVRAFARDLTTALGTVGHLTRLRRTRSGPFSTSAAVPLDASMETLLAHLVPLPVAAAQALPVARLTEAGAVDAHHGRRVRAEHLTAVGLGPFAWLDPTGNLVAVGERDADGRGKVLRGFRAEPPIARDVPAHADGPSRP